MLPPHFQASANSIRNVDFDFRFGFALAYTARNGGTFCNVHPVLVLVNNHVKLHSAFIVMWKQGYKVWFAVIVCNGNALKIRKHRKHAEL